MPSPFFQYLRISRSRPLRSYTSRNSREDVLPTHNIRVYIHSALVMLFKIDLGHTLEYITVFPNSFGFGKNSWET